MAGDRVALVTGAGRGLGAAIAAELHARGLRVALLDRAEEPLRQVAAGLDRDGARAAAVVGDVADEADAAAAVQAVERRWGPVSVLVNNAARTEAGSVWDVALDEWDAVLRNNLRSVLVMSRLCAPAMRAAGWGRIINVASLAGQQGGQVTGWASPARWPPWSVISRAIGRASSPARRSTSTAER